MVGNFNTSPESGCQYLPSTTSPRRGIAGSNISEVTALCCNKGSLASLDAGQGTESISLLTEAPLIG